MLNPPVALVDRIAITSVTLAISLTDCISRLPQTVSARLYDKISRVAGGFSGVVRDLSSFYGIEISEKRLCTTPLSVVGDGLEYTQLVAISEALDRSARDADFDAVLAFGVSDDPASNAGMRAVLQALPAIMGSTGRVRSGALSWSRSSVPQAGLAASAEAIVSVGALTDKDKSTDAERILIGHFPSSVKAQRSGLFHPTGAADVLVSVDVSFDQILESTRSANLEDHGQMTELARRVSQKLVRAGCFFADRVCDEMRRFSGVHARPGATRLSGTERSLALTQSMENTYGGGAETGTALLPLPGELARAIGDGAKSAGGFAGNVYAPRSTHPLPDALQAIHQGRDFASTVRPFTLHPQIHIQRSTPAESVATLLAAYLNSAGVRGPGGLISLVPSGEE